MPLGDRFVWRGGSPRAGSRPTIRSTIVTERACRAPFGSSSRTRTSSGAARINARLAVTCQSTARSGRMALSRRPRSMSLRITARTVSCARRIASELSSAPAAWHRFVVGQLRLAGGDQPAAARPAPGRTRAERTRSRPSSFAPPARRGPQEVGCGRGSAHRPLGARRRPRRRPRRRLATRRTTHPDGKAQGLHIRPISDDLRVTSAPEVR